MTNTNNMWETHYEESATRNPQGLSLSSNDSTPAQQPPYAYHIYRTDQSDTAPRHPTMHFTQETLMP